MPKATRKKAHDRRSRTGCQTCKKRRVKCDETHPKCNNCARLKLECGYGVKVTWEQDAFDRGITFGRSKQYKKIRQQSIAHFSEENEDGSDILGALTLSQLVATQTIPWVKIQNEECLFINVTDEDFSNVFTIQENQNTIIKPLNTCRPSLESSSYPATENITIREHSIDVLTASNPQQVLPLPLPYTFPLDTPKGIVSFSPTISPSVSYQNFSALSDFAIPHFDFSNMPHFPMLSESHEIDQIFKHSFGSGSSLPSSPPHFYLDSIDTAVANDPNTHALSRDRRLVLKESEKELLSYFINSICPVCVCYSNRKGSGYVVTQTIDTIDNFKFTLNPEANPYLYLIVPLACNSSIVLNSIMAASAYQLFLLGNKEYERTSNDYTKATLAELPLVIKDKQLSNSNEWDDVLATIIMLCFKEISSNCGNGSSWLVHLDHAKQFLKETNVRSSVSPLCKFFTRYFISHEVMGETAWVDEEHDPESSSPSVFRSTKTKAYSSNIFRNTAMAKPIFEDPHLENLKNDGDIYIDLVLGCSPYLISVIHRISMLGKCYEDLELESLSVRRQDIEKEILSQRDKLETEITSLKQELQITDESNPESTHYIKAIAEIKRLTTLIYLFARIDLETVYQNGGKLTRSHNKKLAEIKKITKQVIGLLSSLPEFYMSLIWPLFVIGIVSAQEEEERWFVLNALTKMQKTRELGSVKAAKSVVMTVWKEKDLGCVSIRWKDMIKGKNSTLSLA